MIIVLTGRALNVNEAKVDFTMEDDERNGQFILDISAFKHMDTSLMDADVHPFHVRVLLKGKVSNFPISCAILLRIIIVTIFLRHLAHHRTLIKYFRSGGSLVLFIGLCKSHRE